MGLSTPISGSIFIDEKNTVNNTKYARKICSYAPQSHRCLPIIYMADLMRSMLLGFGELDNEISYLVVTSWTIGCFLLIIKVINKRN